MDLTKRTPLMYENCPVAYPKISHHWNRVFSVPNNKRVTLEQPPSFAVPGRKDNIQFRDWNTRPYYPRSTKSEEEEKFQVSQLRNLDRGVFKSKPLVDFLLPAKRKPEFPFPDPDVRKMSALMNSVRIPVPKHLIRKTGEIVGKAEAKRRHCLLKKDWGERRGGRRTKGARRAFRPFVDDFGNPKRRKPSEFRKFRRMKLMGELMVKDNFKNLRIE